VADDAALIQQANYEGTWVLRGCDLIIEAIAERMDWRRSITRSRPSLAPTPSRIGNTYRACRSRRSARRCLKPSKPRFAAFTFNPPRYMALVELINTPTTQPQVLAR
jgi:3-hydroxyacyl-CoA dehydrogenase